MFSVRMRVEVQGNNRIWERIIVGVSILKLMVRLRVRLVVRATIRIGIRLRLRIRMNRALIEKNPNS